MNSFDHKINTHFEGLVVRKDLVKAVKGNAIVPAYVLEFLLGQYCATSDSNTVETGIETVKEILRKHYVHRNESELVRSFIKEKGHHKIIDKISVKLNDKNNVYEAEFANLGLKKILMDSNTVQNHPRLLLSGVWCIAELEYFFTENSQTSPWILTHIKPIQLSQFDFNSYVEARSAFTLDEWIDLLIQSIGFNPATLNLRNKLLQLVRLIPFCERNYNLMELGPKGTGKSHIYSEFSPHGMLISGGEVTVPKLFVDNKTGKIGLVGYWDCVAFDEFAGKQKRVDQALVDVMKNYMANKSFSRGVETLGAEASMSFVGNTQHSVPYMLQHSDLFCELPAKFYDSAFLDRIHFYIPGWEVPIIRGEMFTDGLGFIVDYLAEILRNLRNYDYSHLYQEHFSLSHDISTRDRDAINKTFSGLVKLLFPSGSVGTNDIETLLRFAIEGRKRVKDQLMRIDSTYSPVSFHYIRGNECPSVVTTQEEEEYPDYYYKDKVQADFNEKPNASSHKELKLQSNNEPKEGHFVFDEGQTGISYEKLFSAYFQGATQITIVDPYLRIFYQQRNLMELLEVIVKNKMENNEMAIHVITTEDEFKGDLQQENFMKIQKAASDIGVHFTWKFDEEGFIHARHITTNNGWKISLDRGLDIFQPYDMNNSFAFANRMQTIRQCKAFELTFIRRSL